MPEFKLLEATIESIRRAFKEGLTARDLVGLYLKRIEAYDKAGPQINAIITLNPDALADAERLDAAYRASGPVGPLHGIPVLIKDQADAKGMPTTLGSVLLKDYYPDRDCFVVEQLRKAGALVLGKTTLGELGGGDTHGTLFGSTRNPYDPERTVGGSSGGSGAGVSANFAALAIGQEGFASIRRPSAWNGIAGMRPTPGLVSRSGVYGGWPGIAGSLGPMARTVRDLAAMLEVMAGYDGDDPVTAMGATHQPAGLAASLEGGALRGARIGVLRQAMGRDTEPETEDFNKVAAVFDRVPGELQKAGATVVDPIEIPRLNELLAKRGNDRGGSEAAWQVYFGRSAKAPFKTHAELLASPGYKPLGTPRQVSGPSSHEFIQAQEELMFNVMKVMADHQLDVIVHRTVEHQPTLIRDGLNPPYVNSKGVSHINTFLVYVPSISVPAGFTSATNGGGHSQPGTAQSEMAAGLPVGITFLGRPYSDARMVQLAYAYEQATGHRRAPETTPPLD